MWLLHVIAVPGNAGWQQGLALWIVVLLIGCSVAYLAGDAARPDSLLADLTLATIGGVLLNLAARGWGQDPLALVFGIRLFWTATGAILLLLLTHDAVQLLTRAGRMGPQRRYVIAGRGGFIWLFAWLSGWPSETGVVEASYDRGLAVKLLPESLHYQVHVGPLIGARAVPLLSGIVARTDGSALVVEAEPGTPAAEVVHSAVTLRSLVPPGAAERMRNHISECSPLPPGPNPPPLDRPYPPRANETRHGG
jgi:hypothetical protein